MKEIKINGKDEKEIREQIKKETMGKLTEEQIEQIVNEAQGEVSIYITTDPYEFEKSSRCREWVMEDEYDDLFDFEVITESETMFGNYRAGRDVMNDYSRYIEGDEEALPNFKVYTDANFFINHPQVASVTEKMKKYDDSLMDIVSTDTHKHIDIYIPEEREYDIVSFAEMKRHKLLSKILTNEEYEEYISSWQELYDLDYKKQNEYDEYKVVEGIKENEEYIKRAREAYENFLINIEEKKTKYEEEKKRQFVEKIVEKTRGKLTEEQIEEIGTFASFHDVNGIGVTTDPFEFEENSRNVICEKHSYDADDHYTDITEDDTTVIFGDYKPGYTHIESSQEHYWDGIGEGAWEEVDDLEDADFSINQLQVAVVRSVDEYGDVSYNIEIYIPEEREYPDNVSFRDMLAKKQQTSSTELINEVVEQTKAVTTISGIKKVAEDIIKSQEELKKEEPNKDIDDK